MFCNSCWRFKTNFFEGLKSSCQDLKPGCSCLLWAVRDLAWHTTAYKLFLVNHCFVLTQLKQAVNLRVCLNLNSQQTNSTTDVLSRISNSRLQECWASSSPGSYGINAELWFEHQCRLVQKLDLVDENIWKYARLNPLPVARPSISTISQPPGHFPCLNQLDLKSRCLHKWVRDRRRARIRSESKK